MIESKYELLEECAMTVKSYANWTGDLYEYLKFGDIVDNEMYNHFVNVMPPAALNSDYVQMGEPYSHVNGKPTYETLVKIDGNWTYCGHCHWGKIEAVKGMPVTVDNNLYKITLAKENACLMLKSKTELIDCTFINLIEFESMTVSDLMIEAQKLADSNNIEKCIINLT